MSNKTWWSIQIEHADLQQDSNNENGLEFPVSITLDLPIENSPLSDAPAKRIEIEMICLKTRDTGKCVSMHRFNRDATAWTARDERAWRSYKHVLTIPRRDCFGEPAIQSPLNSLLLEIYDTTSDGTPWSYSLEQLSTIRAQSTRIQIHQPSLMNRKSKRP